MLCRDAVVAVGTSSMQPHLKMPFIETYLSSLRTQTRCGAGYVTRFAMILPKDLSSPPSCETMTEEYSIPFS